MSDGGYDIDEQIKKKKDKTNLRSPVFNRRTGNLVSYPDIPIGEEISKLKEDRSMENKKSLPEKNYTPMGQDELSDLLSRINNGQKRPIRQNPKSCGSGTKSPSLKKNASFSERLKGGWTKEQLMKYYSLSEEEYERIIVTIRNIKNGKIS